MLHSFKEDNYICVVFGYTPPPPPKKKTNAPWGGITIYSLIFLNVAAFFNLWLHRKGKEIALWNCEVSVLRFNLFNLIHCVCIFLLHFFSWFRHVVNNCVGNYAKI